MKWLDQTFSSVAQLCPTLCDPIDCSSQASLFITNSRSLLKLMYIKLVMPSLSSSVVPFSSYLQSFPASGYFPMSQFFTSGSQSIGASASVLPMNVQNWFPLQLIGLISLQSKGSHIRLTLGWYPPLSCFQKDHSSLYSQQRELVPISPHIHHAVHM